jgi:hypothetical protein
MASILKVNEIQHTGGTSAMTVSSTGQVIPKWYAIRALKHVAINWTTGGASAGTAVTYDNTSVVGAFNSGFNVTNLATDGKFIIPVDGIYRISFSFLVNNNNSSGGNTYVTIVKNNTVGSGGDNATTMFNDYHAFAANTHTMAQGTTIVQCVANDYICICKEDSFNYWGNGTSTSAATWGYNQCCIELIGSSV